MADKKKKERSYSNAEILTGVGFLIFIILTYIGFSFNHGIVESVLYTGLFLGIAVFALGALLRMKKAETRLELWMTIEIISAVVCMLVFALVVNKPMYKTISSVSSSGKSSLQPAAQNDLNRLENLFTVYETQEKNAIVEVSNSLKQVTGLGASRFDDNARYHLECFFGTTAISDSDIEKYRHNVLEARYLSMNQDGELVASIQSDDYMTFKTEALKRIAKIRSSVDTWSISMVPQIISASGEMSIQKLCSDIPEKLTEISHLHHSEGYPMKFTLIRSSSDANRWTVGDTLEFDYPGIESELSQKMGGSVSLLTYVWGILINLLMAFVYLMAFRSRKVRRRLSEKETDVIGGGRL